MLDHGHALRPHLEAVYRALAALGRRRRRGVAQPPRGRRTPPPHAIVAGRCLRGAGRAILASSSPQPVPSDARSRMAGGRIWSARRPFAHARRPRRGAPIPGDTDTRDTEGEGRLAAPGDGADDNGAPGRSGEPIRDADGAAGTLPPDAHVRVGIERRAERGGSRGGPRRVRGAAAARAGAARGPLRGGGGVLRRRPPTVDLERVGEAFAFSCERHAGPAPPVRRGVHHSPRRRGEDLRRHAARHRDDLCRAAARHGGGHLRVAGRRARALRRRDRAARGRGHEADRHHVPEPRRAAGGELPQDDGRDGHRHQGDPDQAGRPSPQHAHAGGAAEAEADREGEGDARHLRPACAPARYPLDQVGAGGPRVLDAASAQVQRDQVAGQPAARGARGLRRARGPLPDAGA